MSCPNLTACAHATIDTLTWVQNQLNCEISDNSPGRFKVNPTCLNRGRCAHVNDNFPQPLPADYPQGSCVCAAPDVTTNWAAQDSEWVWGGFTGDTCKDWTYYYNAVVSYIVHFKYNDPSNDQHVGIAGLLECPVGNDGRGAKYGETPWQSSPDLTPIAELVLKFAGYSDLGVAGKDFGNYNGTIVPYKKDSADQQQHCKICKSQTSGTDTLSQCINLKDQEIRWPVTGDTTVTDDSLAQGGSGYLMISFATDYNTWYGEQEGKTCWSTVPSGSPGAGLPYVPDTWAQADNCDVKLDKGLAARMEFYKAAIGAGGQDAQSHHLEHWVELAEQAPSVNVRDFHTEDNAYVASIWPDVFGLGWGEPNSKSVTDPLLILHRYVVWGQSGGTSESVIQVPTVSPTDMPTVPPTVENCFTMGYTHSPDDLVWKGISQDLDRGCRWGLKTEWEGGNDALMCDSPYVVCLPDENTPNNNGNGGFPMDGGQRENYKADNHAYTLDECKKECAYDQRCVGIEFRATAARTGDCLLIDDVPMEHLGPGGSSAESTIALEFLLGLRDDWSTLSGAICYEKNVDCNPYFSEDQLEDVMLQCYCPNNRKGFYTKNVKRTVAATVFCGADSDGSITKRIREAQANRMFHLCENWCLFNTQTPRTESWYHDPWGNGGTIGGTGGGCWREQYAGVGTHRSYCYRVIRDPYTIEQLFIDTRSANMCNSDNGFNGANTPSPVVGTINANDVAFVLADAEDTCDDACSAASMDCVANIEATAFTDTSNGVIQAAFTEAGVDCASTYTTGAVGWAHPSVGPSGECILRDDATNTQTSDPQSAGWVPGDLAYTATTGCNVAIGVGYRRLCSCNGAP